MLIRDAYFLQKERQWLDQERLKLNSMMAQRANRLKVERRSAQVQTSPDSKAQQHHSQRQNSPEPNDKQIINLHRVTASQPHVASSLDESR